MQGFIEITQDGIGRISHAETPPDIQGFYTEDIQTCIVIIITSQKGCSLIHSSGLMSPDTIEAEFRWHGVIKHWEVIYNSDPKYNREGFEFVYRTKISYFYERLQDAGIVKKDDSLNCGPINREFVTVEKNGKVYLNRPPEPLIRRLDDKQQRHKVNQVNSFFLYRDQGDFSPGDFQFDGTKFTSIPKLNKTVVQVAEMLATPKFRDFEDTYYYKTAYYDAHRREYLNSHSREEALVQKHRQKDDEFSDGSAPYSFSMN